VRARVAGFGSANLAQRAIPSDHPPDMLQPFVSQVLFQFENPVVKVNLGLSQPFDVIGNIQRFRVLQQDTMLEFLEPNPDFLQ